MRFAALTSGGKTGLAVVDADGILRGFFDGDTEFPGSLDSLVSSGHQALDAAATVLMSGPVIDVKRIQLLPPIQAPGKIICVGLNYIDHSLESGFTPPSYPTIFARFNSSLVGAGSPIIRPKASTQLDYEGEMVVVIGAGGHRIAETDALKHVVGYSIFNDASIRDYQLKSPQWTVGKNFDATGAFGPWLVTADELPQGGAGLHLQTRLNGTVVQDASTSDMIFGTGKLIAILSEAMTLSPGDIIVSGTPAGVGFARKPPLYMKHGDVCEIEIEGIGVLRNTVEDEQEA